MSMRNDSDTIGNGTRDLPTCSAVPQPTAPLRAPHFMFNNSFFENRTVYEIILKTSVESAGPQTLQHMRITCWKPKATNKNSQYVILIAFPLQKWLHERASIFRYTHVACLVILMWHIHISTVYKPRYPINSPPRRFLVSSGHQEPRRWRNACHSGTFPVFWWPPHSEDSRPPNLQTIQLPSSSSLFIRYII